MVKQCLRSSHLHILEDRFIRCLWNFRPCVDYNSIKSRRWKNKAESANPWSFSELVFCLHLLQTMAMMTSLYFSACTSVCTIITSFGFKADLGTVRCYFLTCFFSISPFLELHCPNSLYTKALGKFQYDVFFFSLFFWGTLIHSLLPLYSLFSCWWLSRFSVGLTCFL